MPGRGRPFTRAAGKNRVPLASIVPVDLKNKIIDLCEARGTTMSVEISRLLEQGLRDREIMEEIRSLKAAVIIRGNGCAKAD